MQGTSEVDTQLLDASSLCGHLVSEGSVHAFLAAHRTDLFPDELFADLFPSARGRPSVPSDVIAAVMVLQSLEGLSDREAAQRLRTDIAWKVACGTPLTDAGFHPTVLVLWRNRLRASDRPQRIFDAVRDVIKATNVLAKRDRRVLDATVLDDAVTTQDAVMQLVTGIRKVRREVPLAKTITLQAHDYDNDPGKPDCAWDDVEARERLVSALVSDALVVLDAIDGITLTPSQQEAVGLLALVAGQDVEPGDGEGSWRIAQGTRPGRMVSVVDPDSRHVHKSRSVYRDGYKAHVAVEPETGVITACALTPGDATDGSTAMELLADEDRDRELEILADSAYGSGDVRHALSEAGHKQTIKPIPLRGHIEGGFTIDDFDVDLDAGTVTCPAGLTVAITRARHAVFGVRCRSCPLLERCTRSMTGRTLTIHPHFDQLRAARRRAREPDFIDSYRTARPMVERTIAWLVAHGHRKVRYRGVDRNQFWLHTRSAALNLRRLINLGLQRGDGGWAIA
jgi:IS5 family transposase